MIQCEREKKQEVAPFIISFTLIDAIPPAHTLFIGMKSACAMVRSRSLIYFQQQQPI